MTISIPDESSPERIMLSTALLNLKNRLAVARDIIRSKYTLKDEVEYVVSDLLLEIDNVKHMVGSYYPKSKLEGATEEYKKEREHLVTDFMFSVKVYKELQKLAQEKQYTQ